MFGEKEELMTDLRNKRTEMLIENSFIQLVRQQGFNNVSVIDISNKALINRQTFYRHYQDKYHLAAKMIQDFVSTYDSVLKKRSNLNKQNQNFLSITSILAPDIKNLLIKQREKILALRSIQLDSKDLSSEIKRVLRNNLVSMLEEKPDKFEMSLLTSLILGSFNYLIDEQELPDTSQIQHAITGILCLLS
uniref:Transcription regulator n=3 Tax=Lactobacillaceae TaxID=33958 RepID=Q5NU05_LEVBR|nr:transcription regulator [Levilactobacillus brevis]